VSRAQADDHGLEPTVAGESPPADSRVMIQLIVRRVDGQTADSIVYLHADELNQHARDRAQLLELYALQLAASLANWFNEGWAEGEKRR